MFLEGTCVYNCSSYQTFKLQLNFVYQLSPINKAPCSKLIDLIWLCKNITKEVQQKNGSKRNHKFLWTPILEIWNLKRWWGQCETTAFFGEVYKMKNVSKLWSPCKKMRSHQQSKGKLSSFKNIGGNWYPVATGVHVQCEICLFATFC